jgi:hypothetical protein
MRDLYIVPVMAARAVVLSDFAWWHVSTLQLGEWGDPANIIAVAGIAVTLTLAALAALSNRRTRQGQQADQVACCVERGADGRLVAIVRNSSQQQIADVLLSITPPESQASQESAEQIHDRSAGDVGVQVVSVRVIPPQRTIRYAVRVSLTGRDVLPRLVMHFRDTSGRGWLRDDRGALRRYRGKLKATAFSGSVTTSAATVEHESQASSSGSPDGAPISRAAYSTTVMSAAAGNQLTVLLVPERVEVDATATATLSLEGDMKATLA